jgi:hypothetical protein
LQKRGLSILESNLGQRAIANLRKNCTVTRQRKTKQGAEGEPSESAVANDQHASVWVRGRNVAQSGHGSQSGLIWVFAAGHWISHRVGSKAVHFRGKKLLRLGHGFAFDLAEVDLAQAVVDVGLEARRQGGWGRGLASATQWRAPDRGQPSLRCPGGKSFGLRTAARVQHYIGTAGIAVLKVPDRRPVPNEKKMRHKAALR